MTGSAATAAVERRSRNSPDASSRRPHHARSGRARQGCEGSDQPLRFGLAGRRRLVDERHHQHAMPVISQPTTIGGGAATLDLADGRVNTPPPIIEPMTGAISGKSVSCGACRSDRLPFDFRGSRSHQPAPGVCFQPKGCGGRFSVWKYVTVKYLPARNPARSRYRPRLAARSVH
jgi:hypothetical protein